MKLIASASVFDTSMFNNFDSEWFWLIQNLAPIYPTRYIFLTNEKALEIVSNLSGVKFPPMTKLAPFVLKPIPIYFHHKDPSMHSRLQ